MKVRLFSLQTHNDARERLANIKQFHTERGDDFDWPDFRKISVSQDLNDLDIAYVWNGEQPLIQSLIKALKTVGARIVRVEHGWFPQSQYLYFDGQGTNGNCSLHSDPLLWLESSDFDRLAKARVEYRGGHSLHSGGYVLIPLQLSGDTQMQWSPFKVMSKFIKSTRRRFKDSGKRLVFRPHPRDRNSYTDLGVGDEGSGDIKALICGADFVYGINSTVLLEAALIGKPVIAIGKSFLSIGRNRDEALAALLARQVPIDTNEFSPWMGKGRGLEFLRESIK